MQLSRSVNLNPSFFPLVPQKQKEEGNKKIELVNPIKKHIHRVKLLCTFRTNKKIQSVSVCQGTVCMVIIRYEVEKSTKG